MALKLDHIVIAVHDLERTIADYGALGFHVVRGGDHPGRATHNALVVFEDGSYFELIAWREPSPSERWWQLLQRHGEGIVDFALLPRDTAIAVADAKARGLALDGPLDGGRVRPDGERLRWQTARAPSADLPFLCGDLTPRALASATVMAVSRGSSAKSTMPSPCRCNNCHQRSAGDGWRQAISSK
jgi:catechol 2,3-dioxygenase-like lactoylglutathione lyase family enzyme